MATEPVIRGRQLTTAERVLRESLERLSPGKSLERLQSHAQYLFSTTAVVGTLLTGLDIIKDPTPTRLLVLPVALLSASLAAAIIVLTPRYHEVNLNNNIALQEHYQQLLRNRSRWMRGAGILFALALLAAPWALANKRTPSKRTAITTDLAVVHEADLDNLTAVIDLQDLPANATVSVEITGETNDKKTFPLLRQRRNAPEGGAFKTTITQPVPNISAATLLLTITTTKGEHQTAEAHVTIPAHEHAPPEKETDAKAGTPTTQ